jgi:signal transduction histidine kinase
MFKMFQKLSARPTGGESSNGLGLSIIKTLTEKLKGTIDVNSKLAVGTEFIISLPAKA